MFWAQWTYGIWCNREMAAVRKKHLPIKTACLLVCQTMALILTCTLGASAEVLREDEPQIAKDVKQPVYHWVDNDKPLHGLIIALHGATLHGGAFDPMARKLAEQGYETYAPDLRGFGRWCTDRSKPKAEGEIAFFRSREDIVGLILALREQRPNVPIYLMGESLGANLSLWVGSVHPNLIDGIVIASPCSSRRSGLSPTLAADFAKFWVNMKRDIPLQPYAKRFLSEDDKVTEAYINDPGNRKTMTFWESMQSMHANKSSLMYVEQIPPDMHILCIVGEKDKLYKASAARELMKRIPSPSARLVVLKDRGHIHFETPYIKDDVMADVTHWLTEVTVKRTAENNVHDEGSALGKKL